MSRYLGTIYRGAKSITVELSEFGPGWRRLAEPIAQAVKETAFDKIENAFEKGKLFTDDVMDRTNKIVVKNMTHKSEGDPNAHYTVEAEDENGVYVNDGHVTEDESKQTKSY